MQRPRKLKHSGSFFCSSLNGRLSIAENDSPAQYRLSFTLPDHTGIFNTSDFQPVFSVKQMFFQC